VEKMRSAKDEYERKLVETESEGDELTFNIEELSHLVINEHCSDAINQIDISFETTIQKLNDNNPSSPKPNDIVIDIEKLNEARKRLIKEVKEHEEKCLANLEATKSTLLAYIGEAVNWSKQMRESEALERYSKSPVKGLNKQVDGYLENFKHIHLQLKGFQLAGKMLDFIDKSDVTNLIFNDKLRNFRLQEMEKKYASVGCLITRELVIPKLIRTNFQKLLSPSSKQPTK
jgi:hypothetical protein